MLPLEELRLKYIPVDSFPEKYNIPVSKVLDIINEYGIRIAEFKAEGSLRRSLHVNPEDVLPFINQEGINEFSN